MEKKTKNCRKRIPPEAKRGASNPKQKISATRGGRIKNPAKIQKSLKAQQKNGEKGRRGVAGRHLQDRKTVRNGDAPNVLKAKREPPDQNRVRREPLKPRSTFRFQVPGAKM